jgi:cell filamentation protein
MANSYYEYKGDNYYCYPNSFILKNKLNIKSETLLEEAERQITAVKILDLKMNPMKGDLNFEHLLNIHKYIFDDIYEWAGKTRSVNISKGSRFCNYAFINNIANETFSELHNDNYLIGLTEEEMIAKLSYYLGELNAIHPFREGNGRTQRVFIEYLAYAAGYYVDFSKVSSNEMIEASADSFLCDYRKMKSLFHNIIDKIPITEQENFIKSITSKGSILIKTFDYWKNNKASS